MFEISSVLVIRLYDGEIYTSYVLSLLSHHARSIASVRQGLGLCHVVMHRHRHDPPRYVCMVDLWRRFASARDDTGLY